MSRGESTVTIAPPDRSRTKPDSSAFRQWLAVAVLIAALTALRMIYASQIDLRTDEAYYWTWSKENVLSFLDHPPMIAWFIRFGTAIFGDTNFGVRFAGILAMLVTQLLLADIVRRVTHDVRAVVFAGGLFLPVLIWNAGHDWASFRFQFVRATATHELSLRTVGDFIGLQFGLVGFILLPVVLSGLALTAWRGYRRGDAVAILLSTAVIVPFGYFFWKSLTLRVGDTWPMFMWPVGFAAAAINIAMLPREGFPAWMIKSTISWAVAAIASGIVMVVLIFLYYVVSPWNFIGKTDPVGGEAGYEQVVDRAQAELQKIGATWIATTDYRTYAMLRWYFKDRVPVVQINERGRFLGFRDPGMSLISGHTGLYVGREPDNLSPLWTSTTAVREPLERVDRSWRGIVMDTYALEKLTGWTPELSPPPDSPLYRWRVLAGDLGALRGNSGFAVAALADDQDAQPFHGEF